MIVNEFTKAIQDTFGKDHKKVPSTSKVYSAAKEIKHGGTTKISPTTAKNVIGANNKTDLANFTKIYKVKVGSGIGFGEIALYWLFNYNDANRNPDTGHIMSESIVMNQGFNKPDLLTPNGPMEVKAYKDFKDVSLGRFEDSLRDFRELAAQILAARNLIGEGFIDIMRINYNQLSESAEMFCQLRQAIYDNNLHKEFDIFKKMGEKFKAFDNKAKEMGLSSCVYQRGQNRPGGSHIAHEMIKWAVVNATKAKPGPGGFMCNVAGAKGTYDNTKGIQYFQIDGNNVTDDKSKLATGVYFKGGAFSVKFESVMG